MMKIVSFNIHGFGGLAKQKSLHSLFLSLSPYMILIQETMCRHFPTLHAFSKLLSRWEFCATNASGLFGGLLTGWNPHTVRCKAFEMVGGILVQAKFRGSLETFSILNYYGPYSGREYFWNCVMAGVLLSLPNSILVGDLNFTLNAGEIWGKSARLDHLAHFFKNFLSDNHLIDLPPPCASLTWKNGRAGDDGISKRLDHFLLTASLVPLLQ